MRYETVRLKLLEDLSSFKLRLGPTIAALESCKDLENINFVIGYALGTMQEYFGQEYVLGIIKLLNTPNRQPTSGAEILSRSHIHAD